MRFIPLRKIVFYQPKGAPECDREDRIAKSVYPAGYSPIYGIRLKKDRLEYSTSTYCTLKASSLVHFLPKPDTISYMNGNQRKNIKPGLKVAIVLKKDQRSGNLTEGIVKDILTNSATHPHGIKVRLMDGQVGRVKEIFE